MLNQRRVRNYHMFFVELPVAYNHSIKENLSSLSLFLPRLLELCQGTAIALSQETSIWSGGSDVLFQCMSCHYFPAQDSWIYNFGFQSIPMLSHCLDAKYFWNSFQNVQGFKKASLNFGAFVSNRLNPGWKDICTADSCIILCESVQNRQK